MDHMISLSRVDLDWEVLVRMVERTKRPLWLEIEGTVQGVVLPATEARRLMGHYNDTHADSLMPHLTLGTSEEHTEE
jgi:hypothetical protein